MELTNSDIAELTDWRRVLHAAPEVSGQERETAARVVAMLAGSGPDRVIGGLGGHGVAAVYAGAVPGPTVLFRCEIDALPIEELGAVGWRSAIPGRGHLCGHDGHTAILAGLARLIGRARPARGRVVLLFQPAEEDGSGAAAVIADTRFAGIAPDWAFALHNMPSVPLGQMALRAGPVNCASMGLRIVLTGRTAHASAPETGVSPGLALARLIPALGALGTGGAVAPGFRLATVTHARLGEPAFGVAPSHGEVWVTLRTLMDADMAGLLAAAEALARAEAGPGLALEMTPHDVFAACENDRQATAVLARAAAATGLGDWPHGLPFRASEDFGRFGAAGARSAMLFLGAGVGGPMLHNPDYDFPDSLIAPGVRLFDHVLRQILG